MEPNKKRQKHNSNDSVNLITRLSVLDVVRYEIRSMHTVDLDLFAPVRDLGEGAYAKVVESKTPTNCAGVAIKKQEFSVGENQTTQDALRRMRRPILSEPRIHSFITRELMLNRKVTPGVIGCVGSHLKRGGSKGGLLNMAVELASGSVVQTSGSTNTHYNLVLQASMTSWASYISQVLLSIAAIGRIGVAHNDLVERNVFVVTVPEDQRVITYKFPGDEGRVLNIRVFKNCLYTIGDFGVSTVEHWHRDPRYKNGSISRNFFHSAEILADMKDRHSLAHGETVRRIEQIHKRGDHVRKKTDLDWLSMSGQLNRLETAFRVLEKREKNQSACLQAMRKKIHALENETHAGLVCGAPPEGYRFYDKHCLVFDELSHYERDPAFFLDQVRASLENQHASQEAGGHHEAANVFSGLLMYINAALDFLYAERPIKMRDKQLRLIGEIVSHEFMSKFLGPKVADEVLCVGKGATPSTLDPAMVYKLPTYREGVALEAELVGLLDRDVPCENKLMCNYYS